MTFILILILRASIIIFKFHIDNLIILFLLILKVDYFEDDIKMVIYIYKKDLKFLYRYFS